MHILITFILFILGASIGSFLNVLIERTRRGESLLGRSYCESCRQTLKAFDLVPVFSYLHHRGKCRYCQDRLSAQYLFTETTLGILFVLTYWIVSQNLFMNIDFTLNSTHLVTPYNILPLIYYLTLISILFALFISDFKYGYLFDNLTIPGIIFTLVYKVLTVSVLLFQTYQQLQSDQFGQYLLQAGFFENKAQVVIMPLLHTFAGSLGIALFFLMLIIITRGRGMGGGDVKLGLLIGLITGWPYLIGAIMIGFLTGSLTSLILILIRRKKVRQTIPFGPFLIIGCALMMFFGNQIINWYIVSLLGLEPLI